MHDKSASPLGPIFLSFVQGKDLPGLCNFGARVYT